jgi:hypothetical protein
METTYCTKLLRRMEGKIAKNIDAKTFKRPSNFFLWASLAVLSALQLKLAPSKTKEFIYKMGSSLSII